MNCNNCGISVDHVHIPCKTGMQHRFELPPGPFEFTSALATFASPSHTEGYTRDVLVTESLDIEAIVKRLSNPRTIRLLHAFIGIITEGGELLDQLKKHVFYGKPLDHVNIHEEQGDLMWYQAVGIHANERTIQEVCDTNIAKLKARYCGKFSEDKATTRDLDKERKILEG